MNRYSALNKYQYRTRMPCEKMIFLVLPTQLQLVLQIQIRPEPLGSVGRVRYGSWSSDPDPPSVCSSGTGTLQKLILTEKIYEDLKFILRGLSHEN